MDEKRCKILKLSEGALYSNIKKSYRKFEQKKILQIGQPLKRRFYKQAGIKKESRPVTIAKKYLRNIEAITFIKF